MTNSLRILPEAFDGASDALRRMMADASVETELAAGEVLMEHGDHGETFYAVVSGTLEVSVISEDGRKLSLDVMHKGALFGEIALFDPGPRTATVTALETSRVRGISNAAMRAAIQVSPGLAIEMLQLAGRRMRWMGSQLSEQVFLPLPARLATKLMHLTAHSTEAQPLLQHSQADLAGFVGSSREAVSKILASWKRAGLVELTRGGLRILEPTALEELAKVN